ncbi:hypothetical protein JVU11DRAFT_12054 [Chiua virens]|nr:hypothetical protein JVU11DRAFT_12054 [Chiua virens]
MSISQPSYGSGPKFRVAICGGGIGGLFLAITIGKYDPSIPIDLYEAHDSIETAGVGITLWWQTKEVLRELGLLHEFEQIFTTIAEAGQSGQTIRRSDMPDGGYFWYQRYSGDRTPIPMHRQHMVGILEKHLPTSCTVYSKKRLVAYTEPERQDADSMSPTILEFADRTTATADVLIGADGIRSTVRKTLFEIAASENNSDDKIDLSQYIEPTFTGMTIYRSLIPAETVRMESPVNRSLTALTSYSGKGKSIVSYPISKGALVNVAAIISDPKLLGTHYDGHWVSETASGELIGRFDVFEPDARALIKLCEKPSKWALHVLKPLPFWVRKRVALIGDAAHAMTPHFGAGAGQAIYDAYVLGRLIAHPLTKLPQIPEALRIYEEIRLPFAHEVASLSFSTGNMYVFNAPGYYDGTRKKEDLDENGIGAYEREGMETMRQEILRRWEFVENSRGPLETWKEAESKLQVLANY